MPTVTRRASPRTRCASCRQTASGSTATRRRRTCVLPPSLVPGPRNKAQPNCRRWFWAPCVSVVWVCIAAAVSSRVGWRGGSGEGSRCWAQHSPAVLTSRLSLLPSAQLDMEDGDSIDAMILQARRGGRERAWQTAERVSHTDLTPCHLPLCGFTSSGWRLLKRGRGCLGAADLRTHQDTQWTALPPLCTPAADRYRRHARRGCQRWKCRGCICPRASPPRTSSRPLPHLLPPSAASAATHARPDHSQLNYSTR